MSTYQNLTKAQLTPRAVRVPKVSPELESTRDRIEQRPRKSLEGRNKISAEETLIIDSRSNVRPAQCVEDKLITLLKSEAVPVSHARMTALYKGRSHC